REAVLDLLATVLDGYEVTKAGSGRSAVALASTNSFEVVVTEVRMRDASGFEVLAAAKRRTPETEVIFITAFPSDSDAEAALDMGALDYLEKPFDPDDLILAVARALEPRRDAPARSEGRPLRTRDPTPHSVRALPYRQVLGGARDRAAREYLADLMREFAGSIATAAEHAGMEQDTLCRILNRYDLGCRVSQPSFGLDHLGA
ncbi:MAG: response regulator, partial [Anaeromyxobacteraceae bacterium]